MTTTVELFHHAGVALYGEQYMAPLALALGVDESTVDRWAGGKMPIPQGVWRQLADEAVRRKETLELLCESLVTIMAPPKEIVANGDTAPNLVFRRRWTASVTGRFGDGTKI